MKMPAAHMLIPGVALLAAVKSMSQCIVFQHCSIGLPLFMCLHIFYWHFCRAGVWTSIVKRADQVSAKHAAQSVGTWGVASRSAVDLALVGSAAWVFASQGRITIDAALIFVVAWFSFSLLLGAYEVDHRLPGWDALAAGLLIALPAAAVTAVATLTLRAVWLAGLAPLAAVPLLLISSRATTIDDASASIDEPPVVAPISSWGRARIRAWDIIGSAVGLVIALPFIGMVWLGNRIWAPGPLIFRQHRIGVDGSPFVVLKCRTMEVDADRGRAVWATADDPRVTRVGRIVRRTRIDELPQLWNVLRGEMSIVGPRPEQVPLVEELRRYYPTYDARHLVRPGLTGLSQVCVGYTSTVDEAAAKLSRDYYYVANRSVGLNFAISARTVRTVLSMAGR